MYNLLHFVFDVGVAGWLFPAWFGAFAWGAFALRLFWESVGWYLVGVVPFAVAGASVIFAWSWQSFARLWKVPYLLGGGSVNVAAALLGAVGGGWWWGGALALGLLPRLFFWMGVSAGLPASWVGFGAAAVALLAGTCLFTLLIIVRTVPRLFRACSLLLRTIARWLAVFFLYLFWVSFGLLWPADGRSTFWRLLPLPLLFGQEAPQRARALHDRVDVCGQHVDSAHSLGLNEFPHSRLGAVYSARPRRRARWVRSLEGLLGGAPGSVGRFVRGRWTPDLTSDSVSIGANHVLAHLSDGVKIRGGGSVLTKTMGGDGRLERQAYIVVDLSDGTREVVFPELLSRLASYCVLRDRNAVLVSALRLRALEWCKSRGLTASVTWCALPGALRFAWEVSPAERRLRAALSGGPSKESWWSSA